MSKLDIEKIINLIKQIIQEGKKLSKDTTTSFLRYIDSQKYLNIITHISTNGYELFESEYNILLNILKSIRDYLECNYTANMYYGTIEAPKVTTEGQEKLSTDPKDYIDASALTVEEQRKLLDRLIETIDTIEEATDQIKQKK